VQVAVQVGVDVAAAGAHDQAFQRRHAHAGVAAFAVDHGAGRATVAQVGGQPAAVLDGQVGHLRGALAHEVVAGAMEAVATDVVFLVEELRHRIAIGMLGHGLVERGVEHGDLRQLREQCEGGIDTDQVGRIVQRRQLRVGTDGREDFVGDQAGAGEVLTAMHHAMADAIDLAASGFLRQRQQLFQRGEVSGSGYFQALLFVAQLPVKHGFRAAQAFGQALQGESRLSFVDQGELDRRATAVDHQDVASRHRISSI